MKKNELFKYFDVLQHKLKDRTRLEESFSDLVDFPLTKGQCFYVIDYQKSVIEYCRGIETFLGYNDKNFNLHTLISIIHKDDADIVNRLTEATLMFATENSVVRDVSFSVNYRIKHRDGTVKHILRQSNVYRTDETGRILLGISFLTDIGFLKPTNRVNWKFEAPNLDENYFRNYVKKAYKNFLSHREQEIVELVFKGLKSSEIGDLLFISKHTVDTHRRKILQKTNCKGTVELMNYCKENGLL